ncbi:MAG: Omp28-related outer membrane protein [Cryomorphaceae bacterium]|nr:Omp28-related outer membrane protein [Cryomorphaceae bacterium]
MKNIFTLLIGTLIFFNSNAQITCVDSTLMDTTIWSPCISLYNPVCGCDGITYDNYCFAALLGGNTSYTSGPCSSNPPQTSICENFDSYQNGNLIAATSSNWDLWPSATATDVSVTNLLSSSGSNSLYLFSGTTQGAQDIILPFGTAAPYELGVFEFSSMIYVNTGTGAYFNFQAENIPGNVWSLDCKMDLGALVLENTGSGLNYLTTTYPEEVWFELKLVCDLTNNNWELFLDGNSQGSFTNTINKIASLNLYPIIGHQFYVDDVCWLYTAPNLADLNAQTILVNPITGLSGQTRNPSINIRNLGISNITSFDVDFEYNSITITENITGVNMLTQDIYNVNMINGITLIGGINTGTATIYNVNGLGPDNDISDDVMSIQIEAITPAAGKLVIGEEATGTWCGWCPRGAVALNWMDKDYEGYWQGIAVHNGDPMTSLDYDNGMVPYISGYPSGLVDRGSDIDPGAFKQDFLQRIIIEPNGIITNGAELNGNILKVSLTAEIQNNINGNYKLACVLVEDSVTGNSTQYYQSNSYSGGASGSLIDVDGTDWANMPSNVPASQMIYRHVGRSIAPSFGGEPLNSTSLLVGDTETICFEFILDPSWDQSQIHIVGMFIDDNNQIDNASSTGITTAINTGYTQCAITSSGIELNGLNRVNIYPNPASDKIYISNLKEDNITTKIYDIKGKLVLENKVSNKEYLNISKLSKGVYQIKFEGSDWNEVSKLIKE